MDMKKFKIEKVMTHNCYVLKENDKTEELILEFYGLAKPKAGDFLLINEKLLNRKSIEFTQPYAFELTDISQEMIETLNDKEYAVLISENKTYSLKRIYG